MNKIINIKKDEKITIPFIWTGKEREINYDIRLSSTGASLTLLLLLLGKKDHNLKLRTRIVHECPETTSRVIVKGVLNDHSKVDFEGLVKIENGAKGTNAWLAAHLLLLSGEASGRAVPNLEILENDVRAGHASTIGKLSEEELFYLMTRGINRSRATRLLTAGFLTSLLDEFPGPEANKAKTKIQWI